MTVKKMLVESCKHCPLRDHMIFPLFMDGKEMYDVCQHAFTYDMDITNAVTLEVIHPDCPLDDVDKKTDVEKRDKEYQVDTLSACITGINRILNDNGLSTIHENMLTGISIALGNVKTTVKGGN